MLNFSWPRVFNQHCHPETRAPDSLTQRRAISKYRTECSINISTRRLIPNKCFYYGNRFGLTTAPRDAELFTPERRYDLVVMLSLGKVDADTSVPYCIVGSPPPSASSGGPFYNLVVCHDLFDNCERMKIILAPVIARYPGAQVRLFTLHPKRLAPSPPPLLPTWAWYCGSYKWASYFTFFFVMTIG